MTKKIMLVLTVGLFVMLTFVGIASVQVPAAGKNLSVAKGAICYGAEGSAKTTMGKNLKIRNFQTQNV